MRPKILTTRPKILITRPKILLTGVCLLLAAGFAPAAVSALGVGSARASALTASAPVTSCAWYEATVATDNQGAPDSAAAYWLAPFTAADVTRLVVSGRYPDARYASLEVTKPGSGGLFTVNGVSSQLTDYRIAPGPGSVNPWRHRAGAADRFTVTVRSGVAPGEANTLPLAPAGGGTGTSYLVYRVYLPAGGDFSRVPLPTATATSDDGVSQRLPGCPAVPSATPDSTAAPASTAATVSSPASTAQTGTSQTESVEFARPAAGSGSGLSPNADTGYLAAGVTPPADGDVVVIRGKAPTASRGSRPSPWPAPGVDTRYWSMCAYLSPPLTPLVVNELPGGRVDYGCRDDAQTALDRSGYYTFVVGTEAQRAAIDRIPGATFLPFSAAAPAAPHIFLLRNMLVVPGFAEAVQNVPQDGNPASTARVMGTYYPRAAVCPLRTLASRGAGACLAR